MTTSSRLAAARNRRGAQIDAMLVRVGHVLHQMSHECGTGTVAEVARRAEVSRAFLYQNYRARQLVQETIGAAKGREAGVGRGGPGWRERALNAEAARAEAEKEIRLQRNTIQDLLGRLRDLESNVPPDGIQRVLTDNTTLKQQLRELSQQNHRLHNRLKTARDNNRMLDNQLAQREAEIALARW